MDRILKSTAEAETASQAPPASVHRTRTLALSCAYKIPVGKWSPIPEMSSKVAGANATLGLTTPAAVDFPQVSQAWERRAVSGQLLLAAAGTPALGAPTGELPVELGRPGRTGRRAGQPCSAVAGAIAGITFSAKEIDISGWKGDVLAVAVSEKDMSKGSDSRFENPNLKNLDDQLAGLLSQISAEEGFRGKPEQSTLVRLHGFGLKRLSLVGIAPCNPSSVTAAYKAVGETVAAAAKAARASNAAVVLASKPSEELALYAASAIASGIVLGLYEDTRFKSESKKTFLKSVDIMGLGSGHELDEKLSYASNISSGVIFGRDLVNAPANVLTPVAAASSNPPYFIHLCYKPPGGIVRTKLAIVGKGLTFDSGGYNIKIGPGSSIELMKFDMSGSAAAFGAAKVIGHIKPPGVEVHFIVAACENMLSGTGVRPGDIVTASNGKTIEVNNTDNEGRLTLADALVYACNQGVEKVIDLATLTDATRVAYGPDIAGFFSSSDELAKEIVSASEVAGEKFWRMPLEKSYWGSMKSSVADMRNAGDRLGEAITAALFLKQVWNI
ncbi:hypothetical protein KSP39_PZI011888 [Platanthera zijinensis]|uniref:Cytosol aminopeptidase domain-containing protein n=1 Tax=Platanthera zijinensis TaxID=2320716 RepID=A0AAP0BHI0_9ASPA